MNEKTEIQTWERLAAFADSKDRVGLEDYLNEIGPAEAFRALLRLEPEGRENVLKVISPEEAANLMEEIPEEHAADLIEQLEHGHAASILNEMQSDDQVDVLANLEPKDAESILSRMEPEEAADARRMLPYARNVAGGLMATEYFAFSESTPVQEVIDALSKFAEDDIGKEDQHLFVVSPAGRLLGMVDLRDLVLARREAAIADLLHPTEYVSVDTPLQELDGLFQRVSPSTIPVVGPRQVLLGVVQRNVVGEALSERAEQDYLKTQGIVGGDEIRTMPVTERARRRLSWLSINVVLNIMAASVIAMYEDTLSAVIALAVFLPIVSDMSGCSGNQAVAVSIRELSLGITKPFELMRVWLQEIKVGVINGIVLGVLLAGAAILWKGNPWLGLVIGGALALNTMVAVSIGGTIPLILKRYKFDPAVASGPILTTVTDMCGFFLVLSMATMMLPLLKT